MSTIREVIISNPNNEDDKSAQISVTNTAKPFVLKGVATVGEKYTFSAWVRSDTPFTMRIAGIEIPVTDEMERAFGIRPIKAILGLDLICVFENEEQVRNMNPNQELLKSIDGRIQNATARGMETDCVSRSFCPKLSIPEDPVCGSAHCQIADYWAKELGKEELYAYQASARSGYLKCKTLGNQRIAIGGHAALVAISDLQVG